MINKIALYSYLHLFLWLTLTLFSCTKNNDDYSGISIGTTNGIADGKITGIIKNDTTNSPDSNTISNAVVYLVVNEYWSKSLVPIDSVLYDSTNVDDFGNFSFNSFDSSKHSLLIVEGSSAALVQDFSKFDDLDYINIPDAATIEINISNGHIPHKIFLCGTPYYVTKDEKKDSSFILDGVVPGNYLIGLVDSTEHGWVYSYPKVLKVSENNFKYKINLDYSPGDVVLENFDSEKLPLASFYSPFNINWELRDNSSKETETNPIFEDSTFLRDIALPNEDDYEGISLTLTYYNDTTGRSPTANRPVSIMTMLFTPSLDIMNLDSISFWYKSSSRFDLEITRQGTETIGLRQVQKRFLSSNQWTYASLTPADFQDQLENQINQTWEEFSKKIQNIQFEFSNPVDGTPGTFQMDEMRAHGFIAENLTLFSIAP